MLGHDVSERTVTRYIPRRPADPEARQRWMTFLCNRRDCLAAMDLFTVPTATFRVMHVFFIALAKDCPVRRRVTTPLDPKARIIAFPRVGGLHHCYEWRTAA